MQVFLSHSRKKKSKVMSYEGKYMELDITM